jgi:hypothetical protein
MYINMNIVYIFTYVYIHICIYMYIDHAFAQNKKNNHKCIYVTTQTVLTWSPTAGIF